MLSSFLLAEFPWHTAPHPDLQWSNWITIYRVVGSMYRALFRFWFCIHQSKSIFASLCNTIVSLYDSLMERPVLCCCWSLFCCLGAGRTAIVVEESLPVIFAKSLTETFSARVELDIVSWSFLVSLREASPSYSENLFPLTEITTHDMGLLEIQTSWTWNFQVLEEKNENIS